MTRFHTLAFLSAALLASTALATKPRLTISTDVAAKEPAPKKTSLTLKPGLIARSLEDDYVNSKWGGGTVDISGERKIGSMLSAKLDVTVFMTTGSFTNQYSEEGKGPNAIALNEAYMTFEPAKFFSLDAGIVATQFSALPSTFEANGFPSVRETLKYEGDLMKATVFAMQSIPTSDTATVQPTESGVTTTLMTYGLNFGPSEKYKGALALEAGVTRFDFRDLNSSAATDSQYLGNTVVAPGPQARFAYEFGGYEYGLGASLKLTTATRIFASGAYLENEKAPVDFNKAYTYQGGIAFPMFGGETTLSGGYYYNESDTVPGSYANLSRAFNNRFGQFGNISYKDAKEGVTGGVRYVRANEIDDKYYTADREIITFTLGVAYEIL